MMPSSTKHQGELTADSIVCSPVAQVLQVWACILHAVPGSRLLLKNKPYACESAQNATLASLEALGIPRIRVRLCSVA